MDNLNAIIADNAIYLLILFGSLIIILIGLIINFKSDLSEVKRRYKKITIGMDGGNLDDILNEHANKLNRTLDEQEKLRADVDRIDNLMGRAITRVAVVRFNAFFEDTAELSYCIALLDDENTGVIISSMNGRDSSRSYAKPIVKGESPIYKLTDEEAKALRDAAIPPNQR